MKKIKKLLAMLLAMTMVLGMSATVFAEGLSATIHVNGTGANAKFAFVQIIKPAPGTATGWQFTEGYAAHFKNTNAFGDVDEQTILADMVKFKAGTLGTATADFTTKYAQALQNIFDSITTVNEDNDKAVNGADAAGVYFIKITETTGEGENETAVAYKPVTAYVSFGTYSGAPTSLTVDPVYAKKGDITVNKTDNVTDKIVAVGDTVQFTIETTVPAVAANLIDKGYKITDTITGAKYSGNAVATLEGTTEPVKTQALDADASSFVMDLSDLIDNANSNAGKKLTIVYSATITAVDSVTNKAKAGHTDDDDAYGTEVTDTLYTGGIEINKYAARPENAGEDYQEVPLSGAKFNVYLKGEGTARSLVTFKTDKDSAGAYVSNGDSGLKAAPTDAEKTANVVVSGTDGKIKVTGLKAGTYIFKEVEAPQGYHIGEQDETEVALVLGAENADNKGTTDEPVWVAKQNISQTQTIYNSQLSSLPSTGGIGTTIFTIGGCALMILAAGLYFASRRRTAK